MKAGKLWKWENSIRGKKNGQGEERRRHLEELKHNTSLPETVSALKLHLTQLTA
jgi:hypothetical protein